MKTINIPNDIEQFHQFFDDIRDSGEDVLVWQLDPITQKRSIFKTYLTEIEVDSLSLTLNTVNKEDFTFNSEALYFYVEGRMSVFKSEQISIKNNFLSVKYPDELKILDEMDDDKIKAVFSVISAEYISKPPVYHDIERSNDKGYSIVLGDVSADGTANRIESTRVRNWGQSSKKVSYGNIKISDHDKALFEEELSFVSLDQEDVIYEGQRAAPRAKPADGKMIIIQSTVEGKKTETLSLYDLSRGGMGFLTTSQNSYEKGEVLQVLGFDNKKFDQPMYAIIRSVREADELGIQYKIGCQFISAEEATNQAS